MIEIILGAITGLILLLWWWNEWESDRWIRREYGKFWDHMKLPIDRTRFSDGSVNIHEVNRLAKESETKDKGEALKQ